jgi:hypothetical protein
MQGSRLMPDRLPTDMAFGASGITISVVLANFQAALGVATGVVALAVMVVRLLIVVAELRARRRAQQEGEPS